MSTSLDTTSPGEFRIPQRRACGPVPSPVARGELHAPPLGAHLPRTQRRIAGPRARIQSKGRARADPPRRRADHARPSQRVPGPQNHQDGARTGQHEALATVEMRCHPSRLERNTADRSNTAVTSGRTPSVSFGHSRVAGVGPPSVRSFGRAADMQRRGRVASGGRGGLATLRKEGTSSTCDLRATASIRATTYALWRRRFVSSAFCLPSFRAVIAFVCLTEVGDELRTEQPA